MLLAAFIAPAQDTGASAELSVEKESFEIGEPATLGISIPVQEELNELKVEFPERQKEQVHIGPIKRVGSGKYEMRIRPLAEGELILGPAEISAFPVGSGQAIKLSTNQVRFHVAALEGEATNELSEYSPPFLVPFNYLWRNVILLGIGFIMLLLLAALIVLIVLMLRRQAEARAYIPPLPPVEQAIKSVEELKLLEVYRELGAEVHYTRLSNILRRYLEYQYNVAALEMTEDEVCDLLLNTLVQLPDTEILRDVLRRSSLAKFARQKLTADAALRDCDACDAFFHKEQIRLEQERHEALRRQRERAAERNTQEEDRAA